MNERIRLLAEQATEIVEMTGPQGYASSYANFDRERFAELIVESCAKQFDNTYMEGGQTMGAYLREKFGVAE